MKPKSKKIYWTLLSILVLILVVFLLKTNQKEKNIPKCTDCNIIFIDMDTLRADHLGSYGYYRNTSPNIDNLAKKSVLFKNAYSQGYWTLPSIRSLLTSSLPDFWEKRAEQNATLPKVLEMNGYVTAAFTSDLAINMTQPKMLELLDFDYVYSNGQYPSTFAMFNRTFKDGLSWIEKNKNKKFFLYLHSNDLHDPYYCKYENHFDPEYEEPIGEIMFQYIDLMTSMNKTQDYNFNDLKKSFFKPEQINHIIAHYDGCILSVDELFGNFIYDLNKTGILNKTILVLFSDHGEDLFENGRIAHLSTSYANLHVPLMIYAPRIEPKVIDAPVALMDLIPTILDLTNITTKHQFQGIDLVPIIENPKVADNSRSIVGYGYIIKGDWELFTYPAIQVYNLRHDPNESNNLVNKNPEKVKELLEERSDFYIKEILKK